jgi:hypothetical protein
MLISYATDQGLEYIVQRQALSQSIQLALKDRRKKEILRDPYRYHGTRPYYSTSN